MTLTQERGFIWFSIYFVLTFSIGVFFIGLYFLIFGDQVFADLVLMVFSAGAFAQELVIYRMVSKGKISHIMKISKKADDAL